VLEFDFRIVSGFVLNTTSKFHLRDTILLFAKSSTPDLISAWFPTRWAQETKRKYGENDESPPNSIEV
jgi:hypothetical protein